MTGLAGDLSGRFGARLGIAALGAAMAWTALWSWSGLVEEPRRFLWPALLGALLVVLVGAAGRTLRWHWYAVLPTQVVVLGLWLNHRYASPESWGGWIPNLSSMRHVSDRIQDGAVAINTYASPVGADHPEIHAYLLATSLLVIVSTDVLACGLRRVPWAGLPVIVTLTVPISVLESGLSWVVFVTTALLFVMLLATEETERVLSWGRSIAGRGQRIDSLDQVVNGSTVRGSALRIGLLTATGALILPVFVPVGHGLLKASNGPGSGGGGSGNVTLRNPIVDMRRDLINNTHTPLVDAQTTADPSYLRLTVLDEFTGNQWQQAARRLPAANDADGSLPPAPGIAPDITGRDDNWSIRLFDGFETTWLPTPYPTRRIEVTRGEWRYDSRTLDVANVDDAHTGGLEYQLTGFTPTLTADRIARTSRAPTELLSQMTRLPDQMPDVIAQTAREVTSGAATDYDRMVRLQSWFRNSGGFSYSLRPASGSGMNQLARFITEDKVGYCEQYAAAMAVMARTLDIPSRVVVGFLAPTKLVDGSYRYTTDDLHAWPEMYFTGVGWVRFEPTPSARTGSPPAWTTGRTGPTATASPSPSTPQATQSTESAANPEAADSGSRSGGGTTMAAWSVGALLVLLALCVPRLVRVRQRRRRLTNHVDAHTLADGAWSELCATARDLALTLPLDRSVREIAHVLRARVRPLPEDQWLLDKLVGFVERARYGRPFAVDSATEREVVDVVRRWSDLLADSVSPRRARVAQIMPLSVLQRGVLPAAPDRQVELVGAPEVR